MTPDLLREILELSKETSGTSRPDLLRAALRDLLADREQLVARITELELSIEPRDEEDPRP